MNCQICEPLLGRVVPMERIEKKRRHVTGTRKRESGGWTYVRKVLDTSVSWYCPNSFAHTILEEENDETNKSDT